VHNNAKVNRLCGNLESLGSRLTNLRPSFIQFTGTNEIYLRCKRYKVYYSGLLACPRLRQFGFNLIRNSTKFSNFHDHVANCQWIVCHHYFYMHVLLTLTHTHMHKHAGLRTHTNACLLTHKHPNIPCDTHTHTHTFVTCTTRHTENSVRNTPNNQPTNTNLSVSVQNAD
jgi:hypothetical protein